MALRIIAEAGVNHNGDLAIAKKLIREAVGAGADYVKFQTFHANSLVSINAEKAVYQKVLTDAEESQHEMIRKLELTEMMHRELIEQCQTHNIPFLSTPFDLPSIDLLEKLNIPLWKIPSGEITNLPYLRRIAATGLEVIISTGMAGLGEVAACLKVFYRAGYAKDNITLLHCTTEYPAPFEDVNLRAMETMRREFDVAVGYSDHTPGIEVSLAAAALGATVIEKHFTIDRNLPGPDHRASLEPDELKALVTGIRRIELVLGSGEKKPSPSEIKNINAARKSIVAARDIEAGELFSEENLTTKRPGGGVSPMEWERLIGKRSAKGYNSDQLIEEQ